MADKPIPGIRPYSHPAGGWGALKATAKAVAEQMMGPDAPVTLFHTNKPDGFDCPGCAWPDKSHTSTFQFCENGAKAVTWEATKKRAPPAFFAQHTVTELLGWSDYQLEDQGRLTEPLVYNAQLDRFEAIGWDDAVARIGEILRTLDPNEVEFYTSGRASNEAAFLYQLFAREYGTNNFRPVEKAAKVTAFVDNGRCREPPGAQCHDPLTHIDAAGIAKGIFLAVV